jgi:hypothetical protein
MPLRRVSFPPNEEDLHTVVCTVPHREDYGEEVTASLFFSRDEHQAARSSARAAAMIRDGEGHSKLLDGSFDVKRPDLQEKLNRWAEEAHDVSQRGLERWVNEDHGEGRNQEQFRAVMAVLGAQDDMLRKRREVDREKLRRVSTKATRKSRHFARMMGKADSFSVLQELRREPCGDHDASQLALARAMTDASPRKEARANAAVSSEEDRRSLAVLPLDDSHPAVDQIDSAADSKAKDGQQERARSRRFMFGRKNRDKDASFSRMA